MTVAQWLDVEESEHFFALEELECWDVACEGEKHFVRENNLKKCSDPKNRPLIILQKIQEAIVRIVKAVPCLIVENGVGFCKC